MTIGYFRKLELDNDSPVWATQKHELQTALELMLKHLPLGAQASVTCDDFEDRHFTVMHDTGDIISHYVVRPGWLKHRIVTREVWLISEDNNEPASWAHSSGVVARRILADICAVHFEHALLDAGVKANTKVVKV